MRHGDKINNLSRTASHRRALLSNLAIQLITHKKIVTTLAKAKALRLLMASYARSEDLIRIGAYQKNTDPELDKAVQSLPALNQFLQQKPDAHCELAKTVQLMMALPS